MIEYTKCSNFPFVNLIRFCNYESFLLNIDCSRETLHNFNGRLTSGRLAHKFAASSDQGARPDHVRCCFPRGL